ncbi:ATP-binding protein [Streptomyces sp. NPDC102467]|uniref:ATP-binding protein n=1 Tax=Streptomyces sp. NPDC102467 TaxID=3366179 RepID=UPI0038055C81
MVAERVVSPVFVGRDDALAALAQAWHAARSRGPAVALIAGEAGIGKSRLLTEFTESLETSVRTVRGACAEFGAEGLAYAPFVAVLRRLIRDGAARAGHCPELARWFPELGEAAGADTGKHRLYEEILALVEHAAVDRPLVVAVEDLHWADTASRELFAFLARNLTRPGVLLLATYRPGGTGTGQLGPLLSELARGPRTTILRLPRLTEQDVGRQLAAILGAAPDAAAVHRVHRRSDGNPLFVEALAHGGAQTPDSLRELLLRGPHALPSPAHRLLSLVSAGGDHVAHRLLEDVADESGTDLDALLRALVDRSLLVTAGDGYAFRHALIRQAVYEDLLPGERTRLHARYAAALSSDDAHAAELAAHAYAAGDHEQALTVAYRAAGRARRSYAYEEQGRMLGRVLELWDHVPDPRDRTGTDRVGVLTEAAESCMLSGEYLRGVDHATAGLAALDERDAPERAALLLEHRGRLRHRLDGTGIDDFEHALRLLPDGPGQLQRGRVLGVLAMGLLPNAAAARQSFTEALRIGRRTGDAMVTVRGLLGAGARSRDIEALAEARQLAERLDSQDLLLTVPMYESTAHTRNGEHRRGIEAAMDGIRLARRFGLGLSRGADLSCHAVRGLLLTGQWDRAATLVDEALAEQPPPSARQDLISLGGYVALLRGDVTAAGAAAAEPADALRAGGLFHRRQWLCLLALAQGDPERADRLLAVALADPGLGEIHGSEARPVLIAGAVVQRARLARGGASTKERVASRCSELAALDADLGEEGPYERAQRVHLRALLDDDGWDLAVAAWRELRQPYELAQSLLHCGQTALAAGDRSAAALLDEAAELAAALGAAPLARRIALAARSAPAADSGLTAREHDVLALLAEGLSNRRIAGRLHISPSTAGVHVSHILAKLGAATRTQAAAIAHRRGLTGEPGSDPAEQ